MDIKSKLLSRFGIIVVLIHLATGFVIFIAMSGGDALTNDRELKNTANLIHTLAQTTYEFNLEKVFNNLNVAYYFTAKDVELNNSNAVNFRIENQITHEKRKIKIPRMTIQGQSVSKDITLVDKIQKLIGGTVTIFQVIPQGLVRISTSVRKTSGKRAIGTYIPVKSKVYKTIIRGDVYKGRAFVVTDWYITAYKPLKNKTGEIIGAIYVGVKQTNLKTFKNKINRIKIGKSGYPFIIDYRGKIVFHPDIKGNVLSFKDLHGRKYIKRIINQKNGRLSYYFKKPKEKIAREKIIYFRYLKEMKWYIVISAYAKEVFGAISTLLMVAFIIQVITITMFFSLVILKRSQAKAKP